VKVQFPWDRLGKKDENSSCWIRVAQAWAGKQWGAVFLPRIGHEVLVEFLEGDPDRPIVTGSVYNADLMPPYALPDNLSQSGLKTHSLNKGTDQTFNELRFEDKKDAEQVYLHAERDFDRVVENNDTLKVGFEKKDQGNQSIEVFNNQSTVVGHKEAKEGSQTLKVWLNQTIEVGGNQTLKVGFGGEGDKEDGGRTLKIAKDLTEDVGGSHQLTVKQDQKVTISQGNGTLKLDQGAQTIEAAKEILLKVGSNSIKIDQSGITIKAIKIELQADANISVKAQAQLAAEGALVGVKASGILTLQGSLTKIN
jgi:type VI secretion system secreted protein VgrG